MKTKPSSSFTRLSWLHGILLAALVGCWSSGPSVVLAVPPAPPCPQAEEAFDPGSSGGRFVLSLAVQPDGRILAGGDFSTLGGQARRRIGRLHSNGTLDTSFDPGADDWVYALAVQEDGRILVGGLFTTLGGDARHRLGRLEPQGELDPTFNPGADGQVLCFGLQPDGRILVGGRFTRLGGEQRSRLARLHPDGTLDPTFNPQANAGVLSMAVQPDGSIVVGGEFTVLNGQPRARLGRLHPDGTLDASFQPIANSSVLALSVQADGRILVGGAFGALNDQPYDGLGRLNADGTLDPQFRADVNAEVHAFAEQADGMILVAGGFTSLAGQPRTGLGRLHADGSLDTNYDAGANSVVYALALQADGRTLAGGAFTQMGGRPRTQIARLHPTGPATESLMRTASGITWLRAGTAPQVWRTSFDLSTNGTDWTPLGAGTRVPGGWQWTGPVPSGAIRARGHVTGGYLNGSAWYVESVLLTEPPGIDCPTDQLTGTDPGQCSARTSFAITTTGTPAPLIDCVLGDMRIASPFDFPIGLSRVTCTASNIAGMTACSFSVTVVDTTPPVLMCNSNRVLESTGPDGAVATFVATATDPCDMHPNIVCFPASGSTFPLGTTMVTCTAMDAAGGSSRCSFSVTVRDTEPPLIGCPANMTVVFTGLNGAAVSFAPSATDPGAGSPEITCMPSSGSTFPIGVTRVVCSAVDAAGNAASCQFQVTVLGGWGSKQWVRSELNALRSGTGISRTERRHLDAAIEFLTAALDPALWLDETHLMPYHGDRVFQKEKDAVNTLRGLAHDPRSTVSAEALERMIVQLVAVDWLLAAVSMQDAGAGFAPEGASPGIDQLAKGNADATAGRALNAIEHYRNAWKHSVLWQLTNGRRTGDRGHANH